MSARFARFFVGALVCVYALYGNAQERVEIKEGRASVVKKDRNGRAVSATVRATAPQGAFPFTAGYRWGAETRQPQTIVAAVELNVGHNKVFVPLSAYADLANPVSVHLDTEKRPYRLSIEGGDASVAYEAQISFNGSFVLRRKVRNKSFPESAWEETQYSYNTREQ